MSLRFADVAREAKKLGATVESGKGSHVKIRSNGRSYPFTCHNGDRTAVEPLWVKKMCRQFEWDYEAFMKALGS